jgi:8-oxo-dGTP diphosphatase
LSDATEVPFSGNSRLPDAVVAVVIRDGKLLFIQRAPTVPEPGFWTPVGGKVERDESQADAAVREVRDEVGLVVRPLRKVWQCVSTSGAYMLHWWLARYEAGDLSLNPREVSDARWVSLDGIRELEPRFAADEEFFSVVLPRFLAQHGLV